MPSGSQRARPRIVLVSPRNPLNVGAAARAMANFGFDDLAVVAPFAPNWREARSAVGAPELLHNAKSVEHLAEAVADCTLVAGTGTLTHRKPEQPVVTLPAFAPIVQQEIARGGRVALVFGPEKRGLTRDDLSRCHLLVEIPTSPSQPSMNLGQAVAVCLYQLGVLSGPGDRVAAAPVPPQALPAAPTPASAAATLDRLAELIEETMEAAHYSPTNMQAANRRDLRLLLRRLALTEHDSRRILGFFRRILRLLRS